MTNSGFVKIWRKIKDDPEIWDGDEPFDKRSAFLYLLLSADWKTGIIPHRLTIRCLAETWHWGRHKTHNYIKFLQSVNKLLEVGTEKGTRLGTKSSRLKICKWESYQKQQENQGTRLGTTKGTRLQRSSLKPITYKPEEGFKEVKEEKRLKETPASCPQKNVDNSVLSTRSLKDSQNLNPTLPPKLQNLLAKERQKEIQFREQIKTKWLEKFKEPIIDSQISLLLGNTKRGIYGFKFYEALLTWINSVNGEGKINPFGYAKRIAEHEAGVTPYIKEARMKCKDEKNLIGAILREA